MGRCGIPIAEGHLGQRRRRETLIRQWRLVEALHGRRRGLTARGLIEAVGTSRSTLYRDLAALRDAGVPIASEKVNGEVRHRLLGDPLPPLRLSAMQHVALRLARESLRPLEGTTLVDELDALIGRHGPVGTDGRSRVEVRGGEVSATREHLRIVERALEVGRRVRLQYRSRGDARPRWRVLEPAALHLVDGDLYLTAWDLEREEPRRFKMLRASGAELLDERCVERPEMADAASLRSSVKVWKGEPVEVAVRLAADVAWLVDEWPLHEGQRVEKLADGRVVVRARVAGIVEATRWVLGWGAAAEVLGPVELRGAVREELLGALGGYGGGVVRARQPATMHSRSELGRARQK